MDWDAIYKFLADNPNADPNVVIRNQLLYGRPDGCLACALKDCTYHIPIENLPPIPSWWPPRTPEAP